MKKEDIKNFLKNAYNCGRIGHFYLIHGGSEDDRREIGEFFSMLVNCESDERPCGNCIFCNQIKKKIHPDVKWITPSKRYLSINEVRKVKEEIYIKPYSGNRKIYIFTVDYMREEAANSFLKILEEPPLHGILLILSSNINYFLPTIISRAQLLKLNFSLPPFDKEMENDQMEFLELISLIQRNNYRDFFKKIDEIVRKREREEIEKYLENVVWFLRDIYINENLKSEKILVRRREDGKIIERKDLIEKIDYIIEVKRRIKYNINLKVGLESILFYICE
ncbi:MAG: hypothetical protein DRP67_05035 [Candidatus Omnitrophota bacterium]|nr:MAG: hypothetical protein DRP67_05035 [Candidatus Omnitrophota bacterium]